MVRTSASPPLPVQPPLRGTLEHLYATYPYAARLASDPLQHVVAFTQPRDQEVMGLVASALSYGRVGQFLPHLERVRAILQARGGPAAFVRHFDPAAERPWLEAFRHRVTSGAQLAQLLAGIRGLLEEHESLEAAFLTDFRSSDPDIGVALEQFVHRLTVASGGAPDRGFRHLLPLPSRGSPCKRLNLFLRWMVRRQVGMDPGPWTRVPRSHLLIPLDTHILRLAYNLGLTRRQDSSWKTAREITTTLRQLDPTDPVKYDFALCHLGMAGDCPSRRLEAVCHRCGLRGLCRW